MRVNQDVRITFDVRKAHIFDRGTGESLTCRAERADGAA